MLVGLDQQIFRSTPPVNEMVAKGDPAAPVTAPGAIDPEVEILRLSAPGVEAVVDLIAGGRVASLAVDGREVLRTSRDGPRDWGSYPMAPYAGRVRDAEFTFGGEVRRLPATMAPHA